MRRHPIISDAIKLLRAERTRIDDALAALDRTGRARRKRRANGNGSKKK